MSAAEKMKKKKVYFGGMAFVLGLPVPVNAGNVP